MEKENAYRIISENSDEVVIERSKLFRQNLRPCIVKIGEETQTEQFVNSSPVTTVLKDGEIHKGYFHRWEDKSYFSNDYSTNTTYGIVEVEDGTVHEVPPECITFTDRNKVTYNFDPDAFASAIVKIMKE